MQRGGRQTVHDWLRRYAGGGLAGLADRSSRPVSCPHQMAPVVEAAVGIVWRLERDRVEPVPSRSAVYRALLRHGLVDGTKRRRRREDYRRWEPVALRARDATTGMSVSRLADVNGNVCFAGATYRTGRAWARHVIDVAIVAGSVQLSQHGKVIRVHPIHHDRTRELGAPSPTPRAARAAGPPSEVSGTYRNRDVVRVPTLDNHIFTNACTACQPSS